MPGFLRILGLAVLVAGCTATPAVTDLDGLAESDAPDDLVLDVAIVRGDLAPPITGLADRDGRWVVFPDGSFHYGERPEGDLWRYDWLPGRMRTLSRPQIAGLWDQLIVLGFADPMAGMAPTNFDLLDLPTDGVLYSITLRVGDERWSFVDTFPAGAIPEPQADLARMLGALAWMPDAPPIKARVLPKRYDFGPDPYARYRANGR